MHRVDLDHLYLYFLVYGDSALLLIILFAYSETDQLYKICAVLGTPDHTVWPEGMNLPRSSSFNFFQVKLPLSTTIRISCLWHWFPFLLLVQKIPPRNLWELIPNATLEAIDLIQVSYDTWVLFLTCLIYILLYEPHVFLSSCLCKY